MLHPYQIKSLEEYQSSLQRKHRATLKVSGLPLPKIFNGIKSGTKCLTGILQGTKN